MDKIELSIHTRDEERACLAHLDEPPFEHLFGDPARVVRVRAEIGVEELAPAIFLALDGVFDGAFDLGPAQALQQRIVLHEQTVERTRAHMTRDYTAEPKARRRRTPASMNQSRYSSCRSTRRTSPSAR
jgi:hypothetical protein